MAKKEKLSPDELLEQALVKEEEQPYAVPDNWVWTKLNNICDKITDGEHIKPILATNGIPLLTAKNILDDEIDFTKVDYVDFTVANKSWERCYPQEDDILICSRGTIGRNTIISHNTKFCLMGTVILLKVVSDFIVPKYANFAIKTEVLQNLMKNLCGSTAVSALYLKDIKKIPFPLPPLSEQQRIVAVIESLFEKLDRAKELAQNALDSFENRKSAILHKAFTGELTRKWREENSLTPVKSILSKIEEERCNLQKKNSDNKRFTYKKSVQIEIQGRTKGIDKLFDLPNTWEWVSLGQVTWSVSDGPHFSPNYVDKEVGVPIISARNVKYKNIDFSDAKYVSTEDYHEFIKRSKPELGDVLLTKGGTTGIATTVDIDDDFCIWVHVALLKIIKKYVSSEYIRDVLASTILYRQSQEQTHGVGNQDLGLTRMIYMALPLSPLAEQQEIVRILDSLLENEQKAKELCDVIDKIDHMKKSILARAFRGELGTNNPDEESALELLKEVLKAKA